jgi:hypothetical protein
MLDKRIKIDVYLSKEQKDKIKRNADKLGLSLSDYMKLKAVDALKEEKI